MRWAMQVLAHAVQATIGIFTALLAQARLLVDRTEPLLTWACPPLEHTCLGVYDACKAGDCAMVLPLRWMSEK